LVLAREELVLFSIIASMLLYFSAVGIYYFEHNAQPEAFSSIFQSLWWAVATFTTVGYGDVYPVTTGGRFFTFLVLMVGLGLVAVPTGLVASALSAARKSESELIRLSTAARWTNEPRQRTTRRLQPTQRSARLKRDIPGDWRRRESRPGLRTPPRPPAPAPPQQRAGPDCARRMAAGKPAAIHRARGSAPRLYEEIK